MTHPHTELGKLSAVLSMMEAAIQRRDLDVVEMCVKRMRELSVSISLSMESWLRNEKFLSRPVSDIKKSGGLK